MNRSNVILIAAGAVVVVASGVLAFLAQGKFAASSKAEKSIKSNSKKLEEVYQSKLFPSPENVEALKAQAVAAPVKEMIFKGNAGPPQGTGKEQAVFCRHCLVGHRVPHKDRRHVFRDVVLQADQVAVGICR